MENDGGRCAIQENVCFSIPARGLPYREAQGNSFNERRTQYAGTRWNGTVGSGASKGKRHGMVRRAFGSGSLGLSCRVRLRPGRARPRDSVRMGTVGRLWSGVGPQSVGPAEP